VCVCVYYTIYFTLQSYTSATRINMIIKMLLRTINSTTTTTTTTTLENEIKT